MIMNFGMDITKDCISYASKQGMEAWRYDEDGWASGFAGGEVQKAKPGTAITWIEYRPYSEIEKEFRLLGGFFTDEPQYKREKIPYAIIIEECFEKEYGYPLRNNLPALFRDLPVISFMRNLCFARCREQPV